VLMEDALEHRAAVALEMAAIRNLHRGGRPLAGASWRAPLAYSPPRSWQMIPDRSRAVSQLASG
jgi:hypothetical protein